MFDVAVVGKGLFGAATARHLARFDLRTVVVGPDEPGGDPDFRGPHGAHHDEARILVARGDAAEVELTQLAIDGMARLEQAVGSPLIVRSGALEVTARGTGAGSLVDGAVYVPAGSTTVDEPPPQGYFNPRRYLAAALQDAVGNGAETLGETVTSIEPSTAGYMLAAGSAGTIEAAQVVIACGAWSNRLLARRLALRLKTESVLLARLDEGVAAAVQMRPSVFHGPTGRVESIYTLPPLLYPDGNWYLKLGANTMFDSEVDELAIDDWYLAGDDDSARADLVDAFSIVFPEIEVLGFHSERCVITYTPHGRPFIDGLERPGMFVAAGGNGHGASWADGVGALAAALVAAREWDGLARNAFQVEYADKSPRWPGPLLLNDRLA